MSCACLVLSFVPVEVFDRLLLPFVPGIHALLVSLVTLVCQCSFSFDNQHELDRVRASGPYWEDGVFFLTNVETHVAPEFAFAFVTT